VLRMFVLCLVLLLSAAGARAAESEVMLVGTTVVYIGGRLPASPAMQPVMRASAERWEPERVVALFGALPITEPAIAGGSAVESESWYPIPGGGSVRVDANRGRFYYAGPSPYSGTDAKGSCDATQAVEVAREYVSDHGGLPADAQLWSVRDVVAMDLDLEASGADLKEAESEHRRIVGRYVEFRHELAGLEVDGPDGGDCIKVRVDNAGDVHAYGREWTTTARIGSSERVQARSPRVALARGVAGGGVAKSRLKGSVELKEATLVYVRMPSHGARPLELRPAWRFTVDGGNGAQRLFVDAVDGTVLDGR